MLRFAPIYIHHASLPRQGRQPLERVGPQVHSRPSGGPSSPRKSLLPALPRTDPRQSGVRGVRPRHRLPHPRLSQRGQPRPTNQPRWQNPLPARGVEPPPSPHHLPKVPLHRLSRRMPHLPLRKKSSTTRLSGYSPLSPTHRSLLEVRHLNQAGRKKKGPRICFFKFRLFQKAESKIHAIQSRSKVISESRSLPTSW